MRKAIVYYIVIMLVPFISFSQEVISGKSSVTRIKLEPKYERGLPPSIYVDLSFNDENGNGIVESNEKAELKVTIINKGRGCAQGLEVIINDSISDKNFIIGDKKKIYFINPEESTDVLIPIEGGLNVKTEVHKLKIEVKEHFGYDMDPAYLVLNTLESPKPQLAFSGFEIVDNDLGAGAIVEDGQLQAGELVKLKIVVQNIGQYIAKNTKYEISTTDENIFLQDNNGVIGNIDVGEVKEFWITVSPNKRVSSTNMLPIYLSLTEELGYGNLSKYQLPIVLNQKPPETNITTVKVDIDKFKNQVARFEYTSNKFTANVGAIKDIASISPSKTIRTNSVAVILGVENYTDLPPAPYANNDAEIIKKYFKTRLGVDKVVVYKEKEVSGLIFDDIFNPDYGELQKSILKGETDLFVFYSGHGVPNKLGDKIYLFPADGKIERLEKQGYDLNVFYESLEALGARSVTVFLDACFSGVSRTTEKITSENLVSTKGIKIIPKLISPWLTNPNFTVFNSSAANETSLGFDPTQTGLFTYYVCVGLQGEADLNYDQKITNGELFDFVQSKVVETSKKIFGVQTPQFNGNRDMILVEF